MITPMRHLLASLVLAFAFAVPAAFAQDRKLDLGSPMPEGLAEQVDFIRGSASDLASKESALLVHFWQPDEAARSFPRLEELHRTYSPRGLVIVAVCLGSADDAKSAVAKHAAEGSFVVAVQKKDDESAKRAWIEAFGGSPNTFLISRTRIVAMTLRSLSGKDSGDTLGSMARALVMNRFDPESAKRIEPFVAGARKAAKSRNYKEATALYQKALEQGGSPLDVGFECWQMMSEQANDAAGAKAFLRQLIDSMSKERPSLAEAVRYLSSDPSIRKRDLDSAGYAAEKLKGMPGAMEDTDSLVALATYAAARNDFAAAAEMQYSAWMGAVPGEKDALKRTLDVYEQKSASEK